MRLAIECEQLQQALKAVISAAGSESATGATSHILIGISKEDGVSMICTSDPDMAHPVQIKASVSAEALQGELEPGSIATPAQAFGRFCESWDSEKRLDLELEGGDGDRPILRLRCGGTNVRLSTLAPDQFPTVSMQESDAVSVRLSQGDLHDLLQRTIVSAAQDDYRAFLNGLLFEITDQHLRLVGTDGHRLGQATLARPEPGRETLKAIVSRRAAQEIERLITDDREAEVELVIAANMMQATMPSATLIANLIDGNYPDYESVIPEPVEHRVEVERTDLLRACGRAAALPRDGSGNSHLPISIEVSGTTMKTHAESGLNATSDEMSVKYSGEDLKVAFNSTYLLEILKVLRGAQVTLSITDAKHSALITSADEQDGDTLYVVMPLTL